MIEKLTSTSQTLLASSCDLTNRASNSHFYESTLSSRLDLSFRSSYFVKIFRFVFFPLVWVFEWISSRISLTTEEIEIFEEILEGVFFGGATFFYDRSMGEDHLKKVVESCDKLYEELSGKWFPNIEGILFLRVNLIKIKMRAQAALSNSEGVDSCRKMLVALKFSPEPDLEMQIGLILAATKSHYGIFVAIGNFFVVNTVRFLSFFISKSKSSL